MAELESQLARWQEAQVIDSATADRIRAHEAAQTKPAGLRWQGLVALILGAILLATGVVLFVSAHWDEMGPMARLALVLGMVSVFHLGGAVSRTGFPGLSTALHAVGTLSAGAAIALVGQIFNIQEHWPGAILLWAIAAFAGWALLRDQAQQTIAALLFPAWTFCEWGYYSESYHGGPVYLARMLATWAVLYLTLWLTSNRKAVWGLCFTVGAVALIAANVMLMAGWNWEYRDNPFLPLGVRIWGWIAIAALPLSIAAFRFRQSLIPVAVGLLFSITLPFCQTTHTQTYWNGTSNTSYSNSEPNLAAHALVAAFAIFLAWWGVRQASKALVNYGIVGFAIAVMWFFFADIFSKMGRSLGLIGLGILFLAGGWALEKMRRRIITHMQSPQETSEAL